MNDEADPQAEAGNPSAVPSQAEQGSMDASQAPTEDTNPSQAGQQGSMVDPGKVTRLEQEVAKYSKVLQGLGIDPESDFADRFLSGVAGKEEVAAAMGMLPSEPIPPKKDPAQTLRQMAQKIEHEGASEQDVRESLQIMADAIEEQNQIRQQAQVENTITACKNAVFNHIEGDELHQKLPDELKDIEKQLFLASTDQMVADAARGSRNPQSYLDPRVFAMYADRNAQRLVKLRDYWMSQGKATPQRVAPTQTPAQVPISPVTGGGPAPAPTPEINLGNMRRAAAAYMRQRGLA